MCGINGFNFKDENLVQRMNQVISHRGSDDAGFFIDDGISLGHQRLSIIDLTKRGHQPMKSQDNNLTIVFNGEIYNFKEIRKELEKKYQFVSGTDTEVVLNSYREFGADCLKFFNGIFSFAIWDRQKKELFLARDRMGVKPLYYWWDGKKFVFSSEIKAILESGVAREICPRAFSLYFRMLYTPAPYTMFKGVKKLMPGHYAVLTCRTPSVLQVKKYWEVSDFENLKDRREAVSKIRSLMKDSISDQLMSDRPVGVYLSGGIDSTAVLGMTREIAPQVTKTYSVGFDVDAQAERYNADFELARKTAKFYGTEHHELMVSGRDVLFNIEKIIWHMDEPVANATVAPMYLLSREAKKEVAVVLGGDGGDELFGGYPRHYFSYLISNFQKLPRPLKSFLEGVMALCGKDRMIEKFRTEAGAERFLSFHAQKDEILSRVLRAGIFNKELAYDFFADNFCMDSRLRGNDNDVEDFEKHFMDVDRQSWLVDESLIRTDKMTMAHALEQRVPILDYRLVELANKIPTKWKIGSSSQGKKIWVDAVRSYLPPHILQEKKRGWFSPTAKWLRTDLRDFAYDTISQLDDSIFEREEVRRVLDNHISGREYNLNIIWALITWQVWYNRFIKKI
ncbi:MAG: asparagine synthase (glutamine-hydrolyzing) [Patescibacteria group bacterium]|nr:asparagine synthase (glutamine-hydrolyzing) [Patescibacteria group bacterium]